MHVFPVLIVDSNATRASSISTFVDEIGYQPLTLAPSNDDSDPLNCCAVYIGPDEPASVVKSHLAMLGESHSDAPLLVSEDSPHLAALRQLAANVYPVAIIHKQLCSLLFSTYKKVLCHYIANRNSS